jgi:hypothetical protein
MPRESVARDPEHPGAKQRPVANLPRLAIDSEHHFLSEIFGHEGAAARPKKRHELWRESPEEVGK